MNVWYLHGLESTVGGPKVDFLKEVADEVFAPAMDYTNHRLFGELYRKIIKEGKPDLIIGSSMGGYFADAIASHFDIEVLLFNPALHSRSIEINLPYGETNWDRNFVVGTEDDVIDPKATRVHKDLAKSWTEIEGMGHRTTLNVFKDIYNKVILNETN